MWSLMYKAISFLTSFTVHVLFATACFCLSHFLLLCFLQLNTIFAIDNSAALHRLFTSSPSSAFLLSNPSSSFSSSHPPPPSSSSWRVLSAWNFLKLSQGVSLAVAKALFAFADFVCGTNWWPPILDAVQQKQYEDILM
eukprot:GHVS01018980.1.p1 GENE.GHVS01018980.1~~GHVS01018980.1.p1  ORF type:complete len:139 (-),score=28.63 GHVS01018980.1:137-553(-)